MKQQIDQSDLVAVAAILDRAHLVAAIDGTTPAQTSLRVPMPLLCRLLYCAAPESSREALEKALDKLAPGWREP